MVVWTREWLRTLTPHGVERGKYFRLVAEVVADGVKLSDVLLAAGMVRPYDGGKRERTFCVGTAGKRLSYRVLIG